MRLVLEIKDGGGWRELGAVKPGDTGSASHNTPSGRHMILFSCHGDFSVIERSVGGVDIEEGLTRRISTVGTEEIAQLLPGETFETWIRTDRMDRPALFRFRHAEHA
jgi:hypothetical protein